LSAAAAAATLPFLGRGKRRVSKPVDTTKQAVPGGVIQTRASLDVPGFDVLQATSTNTYFLVGDFAYSRLLKMKVGHMEPPKGEPEGDLAQSWELSDGGQTLTLKLRPEAKGSGAHQRTRSRGRGRGLQLKNYETLAARGALAYKASPEPSMVAERSVQAGVSVRDFGTLLASSEDLYIQPGSRWRLRSNTVQGRRLHSQHYQRSVSLVPEIQAGAGKDLLVAGTACRNTRHCLQFRAATMFTDVFARGHRRRRTFRSSCGASVSTIWPAPASAEPPREQGVS
jgi:hypothetical protein